MRTNGLGRVCLCLLSLPFAGAKAWCGDWPTWRHDRLRTGVTSERLEPPLDLIWTFRSRQAREAPEPKEGPQAARYPWLTRHTLPISAAGDRVFFTSAFDGRAVCLDARRGEKRWEFIAPAAVNRTPMVWENRVYIGCDDGHVYCLDAETGAVLWTFKAAVGDRWFLAYGKPVSVWPVRTDVLVDDGVAYFACGVFPHDGTFLYAIDARTGERIWRNGTQCEKGWRVSMAPSGHLFLTEKSIWVPRDFWGYFLDWGTLISFDRAQGESPTRFGPKEDREYPNQRDRFWPLFGVRAEGVRYLGFEAVSTSWEEENKPQRLWRQDVPGKWTDLDSVLSVRYKNPIFFRYDPDLSSVVHAGGVLYHTAFETDVKKETGSVIFARDPKDGKALWSAEIPERANQLIVSNERLVASTRRGTLYCFAPRGTRAYGTTEEPLVQEPFGKDEAVMSRAKEAAEESGVTAGYAVVLDCESGRLAYELARQTKLYVVAVFPRADDAVAARKAYCRAGMHLSRITAYHPGSETSLPLPSYCADLILSETGSSAHEAISDIQRIQKPLRGVSLVGNTPRVRPGLPDAGGWYHAYGDAGATSCSNDAALKPPLGVLWYGTPHLEDGGSGPGSLIVDGVLFLYRGSSLVACDQYTGRELWVHEGVRTEMVGAPGSVFLRDPEVVTRLDPATGKHLGEYRPPFTSGRWLQMAADRDGKTLYLGAASKDATCIQAMKVETGEPRWTLGGPGKQPSWGGWNVIGDGYLYILGPEAKRPDKPEKEPSERDIRVLTTIATGTGSVLYECDVDITNCGGRFVPPPNYGTGRYAAHYNPPVGFWMIAQKDVVIFCTQSGADKGWGVWPTGRYEQRGIAVHDGATGKLLWKKACNYRTRPVVVDEVIYAEPWAYDLRTGDRITRTHPVTGQAVDWAWCRADKQCGIFCASKHFLFGRSLGVGYQDLLNDRGLYTFFHSRMSCVFDAVSGGGLMIKPPMAVYCQCSWSLPFTIAMGQVATPPVVPQAFAQPGPCLPVKHLYLDFGATGDRSDAAGNLWITSNRRPGHPLLIGPAWTFSLYPGGGDVARSSLYTPVENTSVPFVFTSAVRGLRKAVIPVTRPEDGVGDFEVRLGFSALPGDRVGQRVFDVILNNETVLRQFDIVKEAGNADFSIWKTFTLPITGDLTVELVAGAQEPAVDHLPLINGLVIRRVDDHQE